MNVYIKFVYMACNNEEYETQKTYRRPVGSYQMFDILNPMGTADFSFIL